MTIGEYLPARAQATQVIVTNATLASSYGNALRQQLVLDGRRVEMIVIAEGEAHKNWSTVQTILEAMFAAGCDRQSVVYALGGGVVGDIAGFASSCYMRGVALVQVPTTLLAQVDSSVGGKTGVNHPAGKNLIGAFHQPLGVIIDLDTLDTLPRRELVAGVAEIIKYGVACDATFLDWIESNLTALLSCDKAAIAQAVHRSCEIKAGIVASDERESGIRAILNFGHTFAHAIENGTGYGTWLHGEAVGCGLVLACDLSWRLGMIERGLLERTIRIVQAAGLPLQPPDLGAERYLKLMQLDKKSQAGELRFVLLEGPGRATVRNVDTAMVTETLRAWAGTEPVSPV